MRKKNTILGAGCVDNLSQLIETNRNNEFLEVFRKVSTLMHIQEDTHYTHTLAKNIRSMAAEIEMNLDEYLDKKRVPFRTEVFLLILFQELFDKFVTAKS